MAVLALSRIGLSLEAFWRAFEAERNYCCTCFWSWLSDRNGVSFYSYDTICTLLQLSLDEYIASRNSLIKKDLIAFDGILFQVLSLPQKQPDQQEREVR